MEMNILIILTTVIVLIVGSILAYAFYNQQRTKRLQNKFGPEYERVVDEVGDQREGETVLEDREERLKSFEMRDLSPDEMKYFQKRWKKIQADFVDDPGNEVEQADRLATEGMLARGYPMAEFDQRAEDLSVDHAEVVSKYRRAHSIAVKNRQSKADTEELRQAMLDYRTLFDDLLEIDMNEEKLEETISG